MGILRTPERFIRELNLPAGFAVCELGDQWVTHCDPHRLASEMYAEIGCGRYVSIDGNGKGTHNADLNNPIYLEDIKANSFDLVTDYGTGEHIFDQAQVWRTLHCLLKVGGYIAFDRPTQGYVDHGFYNTHPTLFKDIAAANDYKIIVLEGGHMSRGELIRGVFQKTNQEPFKNPQQGRYKKKLCL